MRIEINTKKKSKKLRIVLIVGGILVLLCVCCGLFYRPTTRKNTRTLTPTLRLPTPATLTSIQTPIATSTLPPTYTPKPIATSVQVIVCVCSENTLNCTDFGTYHEALACFEYCLLVVGRDVHGLDADRNGIPCESLSY